MPEKEPCFQFDAIEVCPGAFTVRRGGERLNLEPKAIRVLVVLTRNRERSVSKDELVQAVWEGAAVTDNAITRVVAQLRRELGDDSRDPKYIETVPTLGYRFIAEVRELTVPDPEPVPRGPARGRWAAVAALAVAALAIGWRWLPGAGSPVAGPSGAMPVQITTNPGVDARPSFAPDGRSFVYCSSQSGRFELYRRELEGGSAARGITDDARQNIQPAWSPDGKWIAYHSAAERGVWIVSAEGGSPRRLTQFGSSPAWSPDSQSIAFTSMEPVSLAPFDSGAAGPWSGSSRRTAPPSAS